MTPAAHAFVTPVIATKRYQASCLRMICDPAAEAAMGHIELGKWADLILLAPATAI